MGKHSKASYGNMSSGHQTPHHQPNAPHEQFNPFKSALQSHKKSPSKINVKEKTPIKKKGEAARYNVTPTQKFSKMSPMIRKNFGSTEKSRSNRSRSRNMTPTKSFNGGYSSLYPQTAQVYKNSKKEGL